MDLLAELCVLAESRLFCCSARSNREAAGRKQTLPDVKCKNRRFRSASEKLLQAPPGKSSQLETHNGRHVTDQEVTVNTSCPAGLFFPDLLFNINNHHVWS